MRQLQALEQARDLVVRERHADDLARSARAQSDRIALRARRTTTSPSIARLSKACRGCPSSSITKLVISTIAEIERIPQRSNRGTIQSGVRAFTLTARMTRPQ